MSALDRAKERFAEGASARGRAKHELVDVEARGWVVARVKHVKSDEVEGCYCQNGTWFYYTISRRSNGDAFTAEVRDASLRKALRAALYPNSNPNDVTTLFTDEERSALIAEAQARKEAGRETDR